MEFASKGVGAAGLTTGIIGTALGALNSGVFNGTGVLGGWNNNGCNPSSVPVNRYEAEQQARISALETEVKLRDANIYTDSKILELYKYFDGEANAEVAALLGDNTQDAPTASTSKNVEGISDKVLFVSLKLNSRIAFVFEVADGVETVNVGGVDYAVTDSRVTCFIDIAAANDAINIAVGEATGVYDLIAYIDSVHNKYLFHK